MLGTVHYMSPEQVNDLPLDGQSDLYALGMVAYQVLSGRLPFADLTPSAVLVAHVTRPAPSLRQVAPHVPAGLAIVVDRCLAKNPHDRYATGEALADAFEEAYADVGDAERREGALLVPGLPERLSDAQASAIWRRAAQLQADALHRLDAADLLIGQGTLGDADGAGTRPVVSDGHRVTAVAAAAEEAAFPASTSRWRWPSCPVARRPPRRSE